MMIKMQAQTQTVAPLMISTMKVCRCSANCARFCSKGDENKCPHRDSNQYHVTRLRRNRMLSRHSRQEMAFFQDADGGIKLWH